MQKFFVVFSHDNGKRYVKKPMRGPSNRAVAHEIRSKYRGVKIKAIKVNLL